MRTWFRMLAVSWSLAAFTPAGFAAELQPTLEAVTRPFRVGMQRLDRELDKKKPIAAAEPGGWAVSSDVLVGPMREGWVGGQGLKHNKPLWWYEAPESLTAAPGVFGSWVVFGFRDGTVVKLESATGKLVWKTSVKSSFPSRTFRMVGTTLVVGTANQMFYGLDFQTGSTMWLFDAGAPEGLTVNASSALIVHEDQVIAGLASGDILGIDVRSGKEAWRFQGKMTSSRFHDVVGDLVSFEGKVLYARFDGVVGMFRIEGGQKPVDVWSTQLSSVSSAAFRNGRFYVGLLNGDVAAYDPRDGRALWQQTLGLSVGELWAGERWLFAIGTAGRIRVFDSVTGQPQWHDDVHGRVASKPLLIGRGLYIPTGTRTLYGFRAGPADQELIGSEL